MPLPQSFEKPVAENSIDPSQDNDLVANGAIPVSPPEENNPDPVEQSSLEQGVSEPAPSEPPVSDAAQEPSVNNQAADPPVSDFVKAQLERNRGKAGSASPEKAASGQKPGPETPGGSQTVARTETKPTATATPSKSSGLQLMSLTLKPGGNALTLEIKGSIPQAKFFPLSDPDRMVIDLPGNWLIAKQVPRTFQVNNDLVKTVRFGPNKNFLRVVFDLNTAQIQDPLFSVEGTQLTITLRPR